MKKKNLKIDSELPAYILGALAAFFAVAAVFVAIWDWTIEPLFHAVAAPFTSGIGVALLISTIVTLYELIKDR